jgi:hypothetical protein
MLNGVGDLLDLLNVVSPSTWKVDWLNLPPEEFERLVFRRSLCSALIKVTGDYSGLSLRISPLCAFC